MIKANKLRLWWEAFWTNKSQLPAIPSVVKLTTKDPRSLGIPEKSPDVLVEIGRDMASSIFSHPERYTRSILGAQIIVVDDSTYEALFYLFSGKTRERLWDDHNTVASLFMGKYCVMSKDIYERTQEDLGGGGKPWE